MESENHPYLRKRRETFQFIHFETDEKLLIKVFIPKFISITINLKLSKG
jgi:hypothetical protein